MGIDLNGLRFLLYAQKLGVSFDQIAMLGRQYLDINKTELRQTLNAFGYSVNNELANVIITQNDGYAETLLAYIGAKVIHSYDASSYEHATHLHDMNRDIPSEFFEQYSVVLDGGSLEHIFNFPTAIKNCMEMLKVGGYFLGITPANNFMGHGLYQFSPEVYYNIFAPENGFELINVIAFEDRPGATWYSVKNPKEVKSRIQLINSHPVYLLVIARKSMKTTIFKAPPQQSDYIAAWDQKENKSRVTGMPNRATLAAWAKKNLPFFMIFLIKNILIGSGFNPLFFQPLDPLSPKRSLQEEKK